MREHVLRDVEVTNVVNALMKKEDTSSENHCLPNWKFIFLYQASNIRCSTVTVKAKRNMSSKPDNVCQHPVLQNDITVGCELCTLRWPYRMFTNLPRFTPNLSELITPLRKLLVDSDFEWDATHDRVFQQMRDLIMQQLGPVHIFTS